MKRRVRPIAHARDEAVLERVDITILDVARVVGFVTYQVLPEPALPDAALVTRYANRAESFLLRQRPCEAVLDQSPACREIRIAGRQTPDRMQVIGQHHDCVDGECMTLACRGNGCAQGLDLIDEQGLATVQQVDGEEPASAGNERATIIRHEVQDSTMQTCWSVGGGLRLRLIRPTQVYRLHRQPLQQVLHDALQQIEFVSGHRQRLCTRCRAFCGNGDRGYIGRLALQCRFRSRKP